MNKKRRKFSLSYIVLAMCLSALLYKHVGDPYAKYSKSTVLIDAFNTETHAGAEGTGFLISKDGYILTAAHIILSKEPRPRPGPQYSVAEVVEELEDTSDVFVSFKGANSKVYKAIIVDVNPSYDLAVLKIEGKFPYFKIADDSKVKVGERVDVLGNPIGFRYLFSPNYIAAKEMYDFTIPPFEWLRTPQYAYVLAYSEDPGMSGAPAIDESGRVVCVIKEYSYVENAAPIDICVPAPTINTYLQALGIK